MNNYVCIGKIVNTHGIKGELKISSDFELKKEIFIKGFNIYIGLEKTKEVINTYRYHKIWDMVTLVGYNNINEVLKYKNKLVYVKRSDLNIRDYVLNDLIGLEVIYLDKSYGKVIDYYDNNNSPILEIKGLKNFYIPLKGDYIERVDLTAKKIYTKDIRGLIV